MKVGRMIAGWIATTFWVIILTFLVAYVAGSIAGLDFDIKSTVIVGAVAGFLTAVVGEALNLGKLIDKSEQNEHHA